MAPYDSEDARGLLKAAIRDPDPVVFLENEMLYGTLFPVTPEIMDKDFVLPIGKAKIQRPGKHVTLVGFGRMVQYNLEAAEALAKEGIEAEVGALCIFLCSRKGQTCIRGIQLVGEWCG